MFHYRIRLAYSNGHLPICGAYKVLLTRHFCAHWAGELTCGGGKHESRLLFLKMVFLCFFEADVYVAFHFALSFLIEWPVFNFKEHIEITILNFLTKVMKGRQAPPIG